MVNHHLHHRHSCPTLVEPPGPPLPQRLHGALYQREVGPGPRTAPGICSKTMVGALEAAARTSFSPWVPLLAAGLMAVANWMVDDSCG